MLLTQDITAIKQAERELAEVDELFKTAFEEAPIGMGLVDPQTGRHLRVNQALCQITGYTEEQLLGMTADDMTHPDDVAGTAEARRLLLDGAGIHRNEKRYLHADGHTVWVSVHATLVRDADGNASHILGQIQDITERRRFEDRLQHLADHDPLTGLLQPPRASSRSSTATSPHAQRYGAEGALLVLDLDDFKSVNDTLGHNAGDELIVARRATAARAQLRDTDVVARLGGDEFAVLLPRGGAEEADGGRRQAGRAPSATRSPSSARAARAGSPRASASRCSARPSSTGEEVLVNADLAMYEAKEAGRDRFAVYAPTAATCRASQARMHWVERIRDALEDDALRAPRAADPRPRTAARSPSTSCSCACSTTTAS